MKKIILWFSALVGLLGVLIGFVLVVGLILFLSRQGVELPRLLEQEVQEMVAVESAQEIFPLAEAEGMWQAPDWHTVEEEENAEDIKYGKELIVHTADYLGPKGKVMTISNGLNCQNCHLQGGTVPLGNNYGAVASTYPKVRARSGKSTDIADRINGCFERSMNGQALDKESKEMKAMVAYLKWLGKEVPKGEKPQGAGIYPLEFMDRAADPIKGKAVYAQNCQSCHQADGQGMFDQAEREYIYPPLWGAHSYNKGAGLYRLSRFAGFVKVNMPLGATFENPLLTDEEAWDVAAYVNSLERPEKDLSGDWPDKTKKPIDHPFGPYADGFSEEQHKFGPFKPIQLAQKSPAP
ncbi:c-type cytochrome [Echinicola marina]|uniref:c-type cytochrome n=1 Tax=Echinicola marina TaxID=2859768 RepID=UPI001CF6B5B2|nr:c-type cytochrome [Echinicola marina]UCS91745.1 c-type cytochrome [Echinicola marina]